MRGRKRWVVAGLALVLGAGVCWLWLRPVPPGVNRASFEKIKPGMSLAEVEAILGGPPTSASLDFPRAREHNRAAADHCRQVEIETDGYSLSNAVWEDDGACIVVYFDWETSKVFDPHSENEFHPGPEGLEGIVARLKRQWRKWFPEPEE